LLKYLFLWFAVIVVASADADPSRSVGLQGAPNFRDVGGYATADGRHVKWNLVYRSNELSKLTPDDAEKVDHLHLVSVVDLRTDDERRQAPSIWLHPPADLYLSPQPSLAPLMHSILQEAQTADGARAALIDFYSHMPDRYRDEYAALFHRIAADQLPLLVHCTAGKDRTGVGIALLLTSLGVKHDTVLEDYQLTETLLSPGVVSGRPAAPVGGSAQAALAQLPEESRRALWRADPDYVQAALDSVNREDGSIGGYLTHGLGLSKSEVRSLRKNLLQ